MKGLIKRRNSWVNYSRNKMINKILIVKKMSAQEFYYDGKNKSPEVVEADLEQEKNLCLIKKILDSNKKDYKILTRKELPNKIVSDYDLVISAGGDGTVIATAAYNLDVPQLNLKLDSKSVGALCASDVKSSLEKVLAGNCSVEKWTRQDIFLDGKFVGRALNDVCIGEGKYELNFSKMAVYELEFTDENGMTQKDFHKNSGLIVVTGNGSSAWGKAFSTYSRQSDLFSFITVLPNAGNINYGKGTDLKIIYKHHEGKIALDTINYNFPRDSILEIKLSKHPLKVVVF